MYHIDIEMFKKKINLLQHHFGEIQRNVKKAWKRHVILYCLVIGFYRMIQVFADCTEKVVRELLYPEQFVNWDGTRLDNN